jgi:hypothetical protein
MRLRKTIALIAAALMMVALAPAVALADPSIDPEAIEALVFPGESIDVAKTVGTPELPPKVDVCLLEDETFSFSDDIAALQNPVTIAQIFDGVRAGSPDSQFAVTGFRDYEQSPYGSTGDWEYRLLSTMSPDFADWSNGVNALTAGAGGNIPEGQYDAIVAAAGPGPTDYEPDPLGPQGDCGWRDDPDVTRVLVVATDAAFNLPGVGAPHINDLATTTAALLAAEVTLVGLKAPGAGGELDALAAATGGSVSPLSSDGSDIADAILEGLSNLPLDVALTSDCVAPITTSFNPPVNTVTSGDDAFFLETIGVQAGAAGGTYTCTDQVTFDGVQTELVESKTIHVPGITLGPATADNELTAGTEHTVTATIVAGDYGPVAGVPVEFEIISGPNAGLTGSGVTDAAGEVDFTWNPGGIGPSYIGTDTVVAWFTNDDGSVTYGRDIATKDWVDTTPPVAACVESVNPSSKKIPSAPGKGGKGQNQDGFYAFDGSDEVSPDGALVFFVTDDGTGTVFGPYAIGTTIKWTEANGASPSAKLMAGAVDYHLRGQGDASLTVVDGVGNVSDAAACLVPPSPK